MFTPFAFVKSTAAAAPAATVVTAGLVAYYDAGNASSYPGTGTTWTDLSGNGNNLTFLASPTFVSSGAASYFSAGVASRGTSNGGSTTSIPSGNSTISYGGWIQFGNISSVGASIPWGLGIDGGGLLGGIALLFGRNSTTLEFQYGSDNGQVQKTTTLSNSTWYNLMTTVENTGGANRTVTLYLNGSSLGSSTISNGEISTSDGGPVIFNGGIGSNAVTIAYTFSGNRAVMYVYNTALSSADVLQNYNAQKSRYGY